MPHLDEGLLHAYLDDALRSDEEAAELQSVEQHLSSCAECRAALDDARQLREASAKILADAGPHDVTMPSFEELQARAKSAESTKKQGNSIGAEVQRRRTMQMRSLAWAATVVLAAMVGWYARTAVITSERDQSLRDSETDAQPTIPIPEVEGVAAEGIVEESERPSLRGAPVAEDEVRADAEEQALDAPSEAVLDIGGVQAEPSPPAAPVTPAAVPDEPKGVREDERARIESPQATRVASVAPRAALAQVAAGHGGVADSEWIPVDESEAAEVLKQEVPRIDGLTVLGYAASGTAPGQIVRVLHALESGVVVELIAAREGFADLPDADKKAVSPTENSNSFFIQLDGLSIRVSGALTTDSLRSLGQRIVPR